MSQSAAFCPRGTTIAYESTPGVFIPVAEVTHIQRTGQKRDQDEVTNMDSTSGYREYIATLKDGGEVQVDCNFIPGDGGQGAVRNLFENGDVKLWKIQFPFNLGHEDFDAFVSEAGNVDLPVDKKATSAFKLKVTGPITDYFSS